MPTIVVDVMPKAELLDPQGKAVAGALARLAAKPSSTQATAAGVSSVQHVTAQKRVTRAEPGADAEQSEPEADAEDMARITDVRVGKRFELTVDGSVDEKLREHIRTIATEILSNSVIEDVVGISVIEDVAGILVVEDLVTVLDDGVTKLNGGERESARGDTSPPNNSNDSRDTEGQM